MNNTADAYQQAEQKVRQLREEIKTSIRSRLDEIGHKTVWLYPSMYQKVGGDLIKGFCHTYGDWFPSSLIHMDNFTTDELLQLLRLTFYLIPDGSEF